MVRFNQSSGPTPYLNKRAQMRMLGMVAALIFVIISMQWAARPESWHWLVPPKQKVKVDKNTIVELSNSKKNSLNSDEILVLQKEDEQHLAKKEDNEKKSTGSVFDLIDDDVVGIREKEVTALVELIRKIEAISSGEKKEAVKTGIGFPHLVTEPEKYRGNLISVQGEVVRIGRLSLPKNRKNIETLFDLWVLTNDSGQDLYRVLVEELPAGMDLQKEFDQPIPVKFEAVFFKRFGYQSINGQRLAPILIASKISPLHVKTASNQDMSFVPYFLGGAAVVCGFVLFAFFYYKQEDKKFRDREKTRQADSLPDEFEEPVSESNDKSSV